MKVLVVGGGGREHAIVRHLARSPRVERLLAAPGAYHRRLVAEPDDDAAGPVARA